MNAAHIAAKKGWEVHYEQVLASIRDASVQMPVRQKDLTAAYNVSDAAIRMICNKALDDDIIVVGGPSGYYIATNAADVALQVQQLKSRMVALENRIKKTLAIKLPTAPIATFKAADDNFVEIDGGIDLGELLRNYK